jgi:hypothetical protein
MAGWEKKLAIANPPPKVAENLGLIEGARGPP